MKTPRKLNLHKHIRFLLEQSEFHQNKKGTNPFHEQFHRDFAFKFESLLEDLIITQAMIDVKQNLKESKK